MMRKFTVLLAASAFALTTLAPVNASAQRRGHDGYRGDRGSYGDSYRGGYWGDGCRRDNNYGCERDRDRRRHGGNDDGDAVAAGVLGLVLGAVLVGAMTSGNNERRDDRYRDDGYYRNDNSGDGRYEDDRYYDPPPQERRCTRTERQWDRYAQRYVYVDVEVPC